MPSADTAPDTASGAAPAAEPGSAVEALLAAMLAGAPLSSQAEADEVVAVAEPTVDVPDVGPEDDEGRPLRVLVVDDHDINRRAVELILAPLGCDIATAADGMAALRQCDTVAFDVIFMDVRMPELDGRETTRRLRAGTSPNAATPVIAVTADTAPDDIAACMAAGMDYFVSKPLTPPALLGALEQVLSAGQDAVEAETVAA
jgi:CheY-like chemotaxis protein